MSEGPAAEYLADRDIEDRTEGVRTTVRIGDDEDANTVDANIAGPDELVRRMQDRASTVGWPEATDLIGRHWDELMVVAPQELLSAIRSLPGDAILEKPGLVVAANYLQRVLSDGDTSRFSHDARLDHLASAADASLTQRLILLTGQVSTARSAGATSGVMAIVASARKILASSTPEERAEIALTLPHLRLQWARAMEANDEPGAAAEYESAYELAQLTGQRFLARRAASHLAWLYAAQGQLTPAESWIERADRLEPNARYDAPLYLARALVKLDRNDFQGAAAEQTRLTVVPVGEYWAAALWVALLAARTPAEAAPLHAHLEHEVDRHSEGERTAPADARYLQAARLRLSILRPGSAHAVRLTDPATSIEHLTVATEALHAGAFKQAASHSAKALEHTRTPRGLAGGLLVRASALDSLKKTAYAVDTALQAQAVIDSARLYSPYRLLPTGALDRLASRMPSDVGERILSLAHGERSPELAALTPRQTEILRALMTDRPLTEVAASLYISVNTLKSALTNIYTMLGVRTRHQAADYARRAGLR
ncbi:helix-turn-helix transcriptional regulator [Labedella endophytica]|uniref:Helix-turn-helix transcriptional regulator n=1 Tax=Labedella endophytica TaxID=1523160 RepID=A0A3S0X8M4_9MICO|nr:LuxR C-terminal-related transcriptional regulator [Labedella endophytica]RUQ98266.1 helix-turn-helix transcriptional regulator [Labedella endophytica]